MARREDLRAGDTDRDAVATALREHFAQGRLTLDELQERLDAAFAARTFGELARITDDLPAGAGRTPAMRGSPRSAGPAGSADWSPPWAWPRGGPWAFRGRPPVPFAFVLLGIWLLVVAGGWHGWLVFAPVLFLLLLGRMRYRAWSHHHHAGRGGQVRRL